MTLSLETIFCILFTCLMTVINFVICICNIHFR